MTTKKMLILTAVLTMVIIPGSVYAAGFNEHQLESVSDDIGKVADGTFDEQVAQDRLEYLMIDQMETGVSHEKEITEIETEYQKLYQWDFEERQFYEELSDVVLDNVIMVQTLAGSTSEKHMDALPIIGVSAYSKTKSLEITIHEDYATERDLPRFQKLVQGAIGEDVRVNYKFAQPITLDSHTSSRVSLTVDPLKGGASVGFRDGQAQVSCTVGYMATENGSGDEGFVSAGHCTEESGYGQTGNDIYQPATNFTNDIAVVDEEDFSSSTYCDCSFNEFNSGESGTPVTMYSFTSSFPVYSQYTITSSSEGLVVFISGAVSGYEVGVIDDWRVNKYSQDDSAWIKNVVQSTYDATSGDSGASFMRLNGIAGIHAASDDDYSYAVTVSRTNFYLGVTPDFS